MSNTRDAQRGAAMLVVMIVMAALMTAGGLAIYVSTSETRSTGYVAANRQALFCAEAGLAAARSHVTANYAQWGAVLDADAGNDPAWYPVRGYLDDDATGEFDYEVTIRDNDDEIAPAVNNAAQDSDLQVYVSATCLKYPETPRTVTELVQYQGGGYTYRNQSGQGAGNTGNAN
jgi:hypothetical protein